MQDKSYGCLGCGYLTTVSTRVEVSGWHIICSRISLKGDEHPVSNKDLEEAPLINLEEYPNFKQWIDKLSSADHCRFYDPNAELPIVRRE